MFRFLFGWEGFTFFFVPLMILGASYGWWLARSLRRQLPALLELAMEDYRNQKTKLNQKMEPRAFLSIVLAHPLERLQFIDAVPGILVTLGILGTFIGLGVAVGQAAVAMQGTADVDLALRGLLDAVSFKFQASAWGILLSVLFTLVVKLPTDASVRHSIESMSLMLLRNVYDPHAAVRESLRDVGPEMRKAIQPALAPLEAAVGRVEEAARVVGQAAGKMANLGERIDSTLVKVAEDMKQAGDAQTQLMGENLTGMRKAVRKAAQSQVEAVAELRGGLDEMKTGVQQALNESNRQQDKVGRTLAQIKEIVALLDATERELVNRLQDLQRVLASLAKPAGQLALHMEAGDFVTPTVLETATTKLARAIEVLRGDPHSVTDVGM